MVARPVTEQGEDGVGSHAPIDVAGFVFRHFFLVGVAVVLLGWFVVGMFTGNFTDDDYANRTCTRIDGGAGYSETICRDRDTGEVVPDD